MSLFGWHISVFRSLGRPRFAILRWTNIETKKVTEINLFCGPVWFAFDKEGEV